MSEPIKTGDLVQVVRPSFCTGGNDGLGHTFTAQATHASEEARLCNYCKTAHPSPGGAWDGSTWWSIRRLKRIPPYDQLEHFRTEESLRRDVNTTDKSRV